MIKSFWFHDFRGPGWPSADQLRKYFAPGGRLWAASGNDTWALRAEGLYGTAVLPRPEAVTVDLRMVGCPGHGVMLDFARWHGRVRRLDRCCSDGDFRRLGRFIYSLRGEPYPLGLFIPFDQAFAAVKEFIESDGELPACIRWISGCVLPAARPHAPCSIPGDA